MNLKTIYKKFEDRKPKPEGKYKRFAILIPLIERNSKLHLLFEIRSQKLNTQPGEICFPGGGIEKNETPMKSSIRETCEELNIDESNIRVIGSTDYIITPFNLILYPFVGILENIDFKNINFSHDEVAEIFTVPLDYFMKNEPHKYYVTTKLDVPEDFPYHKIQNGRVYNWRTGRYPILFYEYKKYVIWGMTARIINNFINILKS
jgi:8-oxo-dGTP pyrophosphatase MutT (NUDIX family)